MDKGKVFVVSLILMIFQLPLQAEEQSKRYTLSICSLFKDEAPYLKEWIEYHRLLGVEHFYLYNNGSQDGSDQVLLPYIKEGTVSLVNWPYRCYELEEAMPSTWTFAVQIPAFENAMKRYAIRETEWLVLLEVGEFLVPPKTKSIHSLLAKYRNHSGIEIPSEYFSGYSIDFIPKRKLMSEMTTLVPKPIDVQYKDQTKMIFKPSACKAFSWYPYEPIFKKEEVAICLEREEIRVNHYVGKFKGIPSFTRDSDFLLVDNRKLPQQEIQSLLKMGYQIEDQERAIYQFLPALQKKLGYEYVDRRE